jgi:hypothetical protein
MLLLPYLSFKKNSRCKDTKLFRLNCDFRLILLIDVIFLSRPPNVINFNTSFLPDFPNRRGVARNAPTIYKQLKMPQHRGVISRVYVLRTNVSQVRVFFY